jgi:hypothetical protein
VTLPQNGNRRTLLLGAGCLFAVAGVVVASLTHALPSRDAHTASPRTAISAQPARAARSGSSGGAALPGAVPRPGGPASPVPTTVSAHGGGPGAPVADVSDLTPVQAYNVSGLHTGPVRIGATTYSDSVRFTCDSGGSDSSGDLDYVVTGYGAMSATIGIPSDDTRAAGDAMTVAFFNNGAGQQTSGPFTVSLGHPRQVHVRFSGSSQLEISCTAVTASGRQSGMQLALANATIGPR